MATSSTVPTILKYLSDDNTDDYMVNQNIEGPPQRAKKRRLDHLSWEEKMQRKKLKNRVAAQTSRDRKKAKFEQMESAIQELFNKNEVLLAECEKLRAANERLQSENAELHQRLQEQPRPEMSCPTCHQNRTVACEAESGSAESLLRPRGTATHTAAVLDLDNPAGHNIPVAGTASKQALFSGVQNTPSDQLRKENHSDYLKGGAGMPSLPDLLDELESDHVDINALEQLTQSLLEDIAKDLENAARKAADQESTADREDIPREMVGQTPKQLEPASKHQVLDNKPEPDVSEFLLHHNYAKPNQHQPSSKKLNQNSTYCTKKLKTIRPKLSTNGKLATKHLSTPVAQVETENNEILYGTFDEATNTITLMLNPDGSPIKETPNIEVGNFLTVPNSDVGSLSPRSCNGSDVGYESLDSPLSSEFDEWERSVTELFPSLI